MAKRKTLTQSQVIKVLAEKNEMTPKQVREFLQSMTETMLAEINPRSRVAPGVFIIPGIARVKTRKIPAKKARKGTNPFTGEEMMFKAKPARIAIKLLPVKKLKDAINGG